MSLISKLAGALGYAPAQKPPPIEKVVYKFLPAAMRRSFKAGTVSRLDSDWTTTTLSIDSMLRRDLRNLRARARELAINDPMAKHFLLMLRNNVLGDSGIIPKFLAADPSVISGAGDIITPAKPDKRAQKLIGDAWAEWGKKENCSVQKKLTWNELAALVLSTIGTDGECIVRKVRGFKNKFGFALQLIESDQLDIEKNVVNLPNGNSIRMGVEVNQWQEVEAYHLFRQNPNDLYYHGSIDYRYERVPAAEIIHPHIMHRIAQTRGYPWMSASMSEMNMLMGYRDSEMTASRVSAAKMGFLKTQGEQEYVGDRNSAGEPYMDAEPGSIEQLPQGLEMQVVDWQHPNAAFGSFVKSCLRGISSGLGVNYNVLANDLEGVNFSSSRVGLQDEREFWKAVQRWFSDHFHTDVFEAWLDASLFGGVINLPYAKMEKFKPVRWHGRRWQWVDPTKEVNAVIAELNAGLTSHMRVLAERNIDPDEMLDEIAEFKQKLTDRGLTLTEVFQEKPEEDVEDDPESTPPAAADSAPPPSGKPKSNGKAKVPKLPRGRFLAALGA